MNRKPFNEPIAAYSPFVMNTKQEIYQAIQEFHEKNSGF
jgi:redox-sensitive bicupin YhaK (pirin superfamily)